MQKYRILGFILVAMLTITTALQAREFEHRKNMANEAPMKQQRIEKLDQRLGKHQAIRRNFRNQKEFIAQQRYHRAYKHRDLRRYPSHAFTQRGYRFTKRGWKLAYRYDRAPFYDRYGYHYGYFNRHGYYFEGQFYRYDRW
ncbi:MAG: hypothetical protein ABXS91_07945 [Sulfurimonas sp.]